MQRSGRADMHGGRPKAGGMRVTWRRCIGGSPRALPLAALQRPRGDRLTGSWRRQIRIGFVHLLIILPVTEISPLQSEFHIEH